MSDNLCENCHVRPKYFDGSRTHNYCGRTCQRDAQLELCDFCGNRPKSVEEGLVHDYCSKSCARGAIEKFLDLLTQMSLSSESPETSATDSRPSSSFSDSVSRRHRSLRSSKSSAVLPKYANLNTADMCKFDWCQRPAYVGPKGKGDYCSITHRNLAKKFCLICTRAEKQTSSHFCSRACGCRAEIKAPMIIEVPAGHVTFKSVADQFESSWRHGTACPPVRRVYKLFFKKSFMAQYDAYRASVETRCQFVAKGRTAGNENRRWHGTNRECQLGDNGNTTLCLSNTCSLCSIIRSSFDLNRFRAKTGWGRFGAGIYTSSTSSKSDAYSYNATPSTLKAMLLNKVVVGRGYKTTQDNSSLTAPPAGYDSVLGEVGASLNHDELIVYSDDAIRPSFLVLYEP